MSGIAKEEKKRFPLRRGYMSCAKPISYGLCLNRNYLLRARLDMKSDIEID